MQSVLKKNWRKLNKWRKKEEMADLKDNLQHTSSPWNCLRVGTILAKTWFRTWEMHPFSWSIYCSLKPSQKWSQRKGNRDVILNNAKLHRNWSKNWYVQRKSGQRYSSKTLWRLSMVWGCLSASGVGDLCQSWWIMNSEKHHQSLSQHTVKGSKWLYFPAWQWSKGRNI